MFHSSNKNAATLTEAFMEVEPAMREQLTQFLSDPEDVDDMLYETYAKAYDAMQRQPLVSPKHYLLRTAKTLAKRHVQQQASSVVDHYSPATLGDLSRTGTSTEEALLHQEAFEQLDAAIQQLPSQCQRVVVLRCRKQMSYKDIAATLNISVKAVEKHLSTAVKRCTKLLKPLSEPDYETAASTSKGKQEASS